MESSSRKCVLRVDWASHFSFTLSAESEYVSSHFYFGRAIGRPARDERAVDDDRRGPKKFPKIPLSWLRRSTIPCRAVGSRLWTIHACAPGSGSKTMLLLSCRDTPTFLADFVSIERPSSILEKKQENMGNVMMDPWAKTSPYGHHVDRELALSSIFPARHLTFWFVTPFHNQPGKNKQKDNRKNQVYCHNYHILYIEIKCKNRPAIWFRPEDDRVICFFGPEKRREKFEYGARVLHLHGLRVCTAHGAGILIERWYLAQGSLWLVTRFMTGKEKKKKLEPARKMSRWRRPLRSNQELSSQTYWWIHLHRWWCCVVVLVCSIGSYMARLVAVCSLSLQPC